MQYFYFLSIKYLAFRCSPSTERGLIFIWELKAVRWVMHIVEISSSGLASVSKTFSCHEVDLYQLCLFKMVIANYFTPLCTSIDYHVPFFPLSLFLFVFKWLKDVFFSLGLHVRLFLCMILQPNSKRFKWKIKMECNYLKRKKTTFFTSIL